MSFFTFKRSQVDANYLEILFDGQVFEEILFPYKVTAPSFGFSSSQELVSWLDTYEIAKVKEAAYKLLAMRSYSSHALASKLKLKGFSRKAIEAVLQKVVCQGFIEDSEQAKRIIEQKLKQGHGPLKIQKALLVKGYKVDSALMISEDEQIQSILSLVDVLKKLDKKKQIVFLRKKGFSSSVIFKALNELSL